MLRDLCHEFEKYEEEINWLNYKKNTFKFYYIL